MFKTARGDGEGSPYVGAWYAARGFGRSGGGGVSVFETAGGLPIEGTRVGVAAPSARGEAGMACKYLNKMGIVESRW